MIKILLTLSHGQAFVERGFSTNKGVLEDNLKERTIAAKRTILDALDYQIGESGDVSKVDINESMISHFLKSSSRYKAFLGISSDETSIENPESFNKRKELLKEKELEMKLSKSRKILLKEADDLALRAVRENKMGLVSESNGMRKRALEIEKELECCTAKIQKLD